MMAETEEIMEDVSSQSNITTSPSIVMSPEVVSTSASVPISSQNKTRIPEEVIASEGLISPRDRTTKEAISEMETETTIEKNIQIFVTSPLSEVTSSNTVPSVKETPSRNTTISSRSHKTVGSSAQSMESKNLSPQSRNKESIQHVQCPTEEVVKQDSTTDSLPKLTSPSKSTSPAKEFTKQEINKELTEKASTTKPAVKDTPITKDKIEIPSGTKPNPESTKLLNFRKCKYCQGIILRKMGIPFCSKSCAEMFKMVPSDVSLTTGEVTTTLSFTKREQDWKYYKEVLRESGPPLTSFHQVTENVNGLEPGMKLEVLDILNPQHFCVATVTKILGHRLCIRYDGFGDDATNDIWFNYQAEELFPIGWCASHGYSLQPPTGITSTAQEWKAFLAKTLCGALAAPSSLFRKAQNRRQLRCHSYCTGDRVEVIHPKRPDLICTATVTKSLGPYYFFVTTDILPGVAAHSFYGYADCPGIYPNGWSESRGLFLDGSDPSDIKMGRKSSVVFDFANSTRKNRPGLFRVSHKVEALYNNNVYIGTVAEIFGRVNLLVFDGLENKCKFFDKFAIDVYPIGWCETTESILNTPFGKVNFMPHGVQQKRSNIVIQSASFKSIQIQKDKDLTETGNTNENEKLDGVVGHFDDGEVDLDQMIFKLYFTSVQHRQDMDKFVVWFLNHYRYKANSYVPKHQMVEKFHSSLNLKLTHIWFAVVYRIFPGVTTIRRCVEGKIINSLKNLEEKNQPNSKSAVFLKDAVEFFQSLNIQVLFDTERLVAIIAIGKNAQVPEDTKEIFTTGKSRQKSSLLIITADVHQENFNLSNYTFYYEDKICEPPLIKTISNIGEFRATILLCSFAKLCTGVEIQAKDETSSKIYNLIENGRFHSPECDVMTFPHKGNLCANCKAIKFKSSPEKTRESISSPDYDEIEQNKEAFGDSSKAKDDAILTELMFHFNTTCYGGDSLDPSRVSKLFKTTPNEKPVQALKELVQKLMDTALDQGKFIDSLESVFGSKIYLRDVAKIVKKPLARLNTRAKVKKILKRLVKRLQCCRYFISIDESTPCKAKCKGNNITLTSSISLAQKLRNQLEATSSVSSPIARTMSANISSSYPVSIGPQHQRKSPMKPPPIYQPKQQQVYLQQQQPPPNSPNIIRSTNSMQLVYQIPQSKNNTSNPQIVVQNPEGHRFKQPTQYVLQQPTSSNVTYMVVSKDNTVQNIHVPLSVQSPISVQSSNNPHMQIKHLSQYSNPSSGVTKMMANVSKSSLVSDIDDPQRKNSIKIVKGNISSNQKILIKKPDPIYISDNLNKPVNITSPLNKSPNYIDNSSPLHYPKIQYVKSLNENAQQHQQHLQQQQQQHSDSRRPVVQTVEKNQQKHVHKLHHGNARVKYVEFKPFHSQQPPENSNYKQPFKQTIYYPTHIPGQTSQTGQSSNHLTIHTPAANNPNIPQQSPPALRPPPPAPPRTLALSSPPSLMASPELRPKFNFAGTPVNASPMNPLSPNNKVGLNQRLTSGVDGTNRLTVYPQGHNQNIAKLGENIKQGDMVDARGKNISGSSTPTTVTMTYIPIQTQSKDNKYVYVPVNSIQSTNNNGQQILLYPQNQQLKDPNGKPVVLPPQYASTNKPPITSQNQNNPYTTVRLQGVKQNDNMNKSNPPIDLQPKGFKYQLSGTIGGMSNISNNPTKYTQENNQIVSQNEFINNNKTSDYDDLMKNEKLVEIKDQLNKELKIKDKNEENKSSEEPQEIEDGKDKIDGRVNENIKEEQVEMKSNENEENITPPKKRKRRGRPPASSKSPDKAEGPRSKLSMIQGNPMPPSTHGNPITLANRVLTEAFYNKQKEMQNRARFIEDPLTKCPDLPKNPDEWTQEHVYTFIKGTDCSQYADTLKDEEVDGKSFVLLTREALMEFTGMRLGPALKISGYAAGLRARKRMFSIHAYNQEQGEQQQKPKHKSRKKTFYKRGPYNKSPKNKKHEQTAKVANTPIDQSKIKKEVSENHDLSNDVTINDVTSNSTEITNPVVPMDVN